MVEILCGGALAIVDRWRLGTPLVDGAAVCRNHQTQAFSVKEAYLSDPQTVCVADHGWSRGMDVELGFDFQL